MRFFHPIYASSPHGRSFRTAILSAAAVLLVFSFGCGNDASVYQELIGNWTTDEKQYEDRYIEIKDELVIFGTGDREPNLFFIKTVKKNENDGIREYSLDCQNLVETNFIFVFTLEGNNEQLVMRLKNPQQVIWKKIPAVDRDISV